MLKPMPTRRTTAQISAHILSRLKEVAKERNLPLYALLDEVVNDYLKHHTKNQKSKLFQKSPESLPSYRQLFELKPLTGKNKWFTTGIGAVGWALYTLLAD
jgi:hypothetical protein